MLSADGHKRLNSGNDTAEEHKRLISGIDTLLKSISVNS